MHNESGLNTSSKRVELKLEKNTLNINYSSMNIKNYSYTNRVGKTPPLRWFRGSSEERWKHNCGRSFHRFLNPRTGNVCSMLVNRREAGPVSWTRNACQSTYFNSIHRIWLRTPINPPLPSTPSPFPSRLCVLSSGTLSSDFYIKINMLYDFRSYMRIRLGTRKTLTKTTDREKQILP